MISTSNTVPAANSLKATKLVVDCVSDSSNSVYPVAAVVKISWTRRTRTPVDPGAFWYTDAFPHIK